MRRLAVRGVVAVFMGVSAWLALACGVSDSSTGQAKAVPTPPAPGWYAEVEDASYIAYERVTYVRIPKARIEPAGEVRLTQQVRRVQSFRLKESGTSAIRFTDDAGKGWLAWQPAIVLRARREFAQAQGGQPASVTTLGVARVQWPDSCLGIAQSGCSGESMAGFRITLRLGAATATYHSDLSDRLTRAPA